MGFTYVNVGANGVNAATGVSGGANAEEMAYAIDALGFPSAFHTSGNAFVELRADFVFAASLPSAGALATPFVHAVDAPGLAAAVHVEGIALADTSAFAVRAIVFPASSTRAYEAFILQQQIAWVTHRA